MSAIHNSETNKLVRAIHDHLDVFVEGEELIVFHQSDDGFPHIDIYWIKSNPEYRPFSILLTGGLSTNPMNIPEATEFDKYLEVAMLLPNDWPLGELGNNQIENDWPIQQLRSIAMTPYASDTWVGIGHTFGRGSDLNDLYPGTPFNSTMLCESIMLPEKFLEFEVDDHMVRILTAVPLYPEELEFKLNNDSHALLAKFEEFEISEIVSKSRPNTCL